MKAIAVSSRTCIAAANRRWNDTGIDVAYGDVLHFSAIGNWFDASYEASPDGYDAPVWLDILARLRRCPDANWFELCGVIGRVSTGAFAIGSKSEISMPRNGRLYLFANDVKGFYWNNSGALQVTISAASL